MNPSLLNRRKARRPCRAKDDFELMSGNGAKLLALTKALSTQWQQTKESWRDAKSEEFERQYLQELFVSVDRSVGVIQQMDQLIARIRSDCE